MGGSSGAEKIYIPQAAAPPTAAQSAADYAAALPVQYEAALKYQPQFDQLQYDAYAKLAPQYTALYDQLQKQYYPQTYGLQEQLAKTASEASGATQIPDWMQQQYRSNVSAQLGENVNAPIGADYLSRGMIDQAQQYRQYYQNLGLSLAGRQPLTSPQYQQSGYSVANNAGGNYGNMLQGYGMYNQATRPITQATGTPNWMLGLQSAGNIAGSLGAAAMMCWVASACFGGWHKPKTIYARYFMNNHAPKWLLNIYVKYGEKIASNNIAVDILKPVFEILSSVGRKLLYGK